MAHIIPDGTATGWQCPACRHVYGPQVAECPRCPEAPPAPLFPFPGAVRLSSEYGAIPDLPPRRPMCKCSLVPVPCPPSREGGTCGCDEPDGDLRSAPNAEAHVDLLERAWGIIANAGWNAGTGDVSEPKSAGWHEAAVRWRDNYHGWLSAHLSPSGYQSWEQLADGLRRERDSLSAENERLCRDDGRSEPILDSPVLRLPGYMAVHGAVQITGITGAWAEVLPGLEATLRSVRTGHAEVEFRLTPPDGKQHD